MPAPEAIARRIERRLAEVDAQGLRRKLKPPSGIDLSSNDYLGLARDPRVSKAMADAALREGAGSTGSRLLRGERECFQAVEERFARFKGTERSLYFSSGYLANLAVLTTFAEQGDMIFSDSLNHASLIDGVRLSRASRSVFPHGDVDALRSKLEDAPKGGAKFVVVESIFSMDGDEAPLAAYAQVCRDKGAALIVDEAHAVGIYGDRGSGLMEATGIADRVLVSTNPAGKALGVSGAFVAGNGQTIEYLLQRARPFIFSTAAVPAVAAAIETALDIVEREPDRRTRVLALARRLRHRLKMPGCSQIVPIPIGENERAVAIAERLQAEGFDVRAVRPPTVPVGTARLRVSINQGLSEAIIDQFADSLEKALSS
ncbi:MAG: 8-amino-7-oxononanoate synthase [Bryobacteraceae bacterium]